MITRLEAIQDIRCGRGISNSFVGHEDVNGRKHTFTVIVRRDPRTMTAVAYIDCTAMRRTYTVRLTGKQTLAYIKRHYARKVVQLPDTLKSIPVVPMCEVA